MVRMVLTPGVGVGSDLKGHQPAGMPETDSVSVWVTQVYVHVKTC